MFFLSIAFPSSSYNLDVASVALPTTEGMIEVLPFHTPLVIALAPGFVRATLPKQEEGASDLQQPSQTPPSPTATSFASKPDELDQEADLEVRAPFFFVTSGIAHILPSKTVLILGGGTACEGDFFSHQPHEIASLQEKLWNKHQAQSLASFSFPTLGVNTP